MESSYSARWNWFHSANETWIRTHTIYIYSKVLCKWSRDRDREIRTMDFLRASKLTFRLWLLDESTIHPVFEMQSTTPIIKTHPSNNQFIKYGMVIVNRDSNLVNTSLSLCLSLSLSQYWLICVLVHFDQYMNHVLDQSYQISFVL